MDFYEEMDVGELYLSLLDAEDNLNTLLRKKDYEGSQSQARIIIRGISEMEELVKKHPNEALLRQQSEKDIKRVYRKAIDLIFSPDEDPRSPVSIAFWEDLYAHTTVPY